MADQENLQEAQQGPAAPAQQQHDPSEAFQNDEELAAIRNRGKGQYGCSHYRRRVKFITPCCNEEWWCRHCHNKAHDTDEQDWQKKHELDRKAIQELVCALCGQRQPVGTRCTACGVDFGAYSCLKCRFFDDDLAKQPYHCDECGICRIGGRENYFHCSTCGSCYSMALQGNHQCVERAMHQNCPICFEFLFESVDPTTVLKCGHTIHTQCVRELEANPNAVCPTCPICKKSLGDYSAHWREIDRQVALLPVPPEYRGWRADILCNDCSHSSNVAFHLLGLKCTACGSYNTRRMGLHTSDGSPLETAGLPQRQVGANGGGPAGLGGPGLGAGMAPNFVENLLAAMWGPGGPGGAAGDVDGEEEEDDNDNDDDDEEEEEWVSGEEVDDSGEWVLDDGEDDEAAEEGEQHPVELDELEGQAADERQGLGQQQPAALQTEAGSGQGGSGMRQQPGEALAAQQRQQDVESVGQGAVQQAAAAAGIAATAAAAPAAAAAHAFEAAGGSGSGGGGPAAGRGAAEPQP